MKAKRNSQPKGRHGLLDWVLTGAKVAGQILLWLKTSEEVCQWLWKHFM